MTNIPIDKKLYSKVKSIAKKKFNVWPSAYGSAWLVREYKKRGGEYKKYRVNMTFSPRSKKYGLSRWFLEQWIDVCKLPKIVSCGRKNTSKGEYPYCRPRYKISSNTPNIAKSLSMTEIKRRCSRKRRNPYKKVYSIKKSRKRSSKKII